MEGTTRHHAIETPEAGHAVDTDDPVLQQLRKLREGRGLTRARLAQCGDLLSALGTSSPAEGSGRLQGVLSQMEDGRNTRALKVDLGLDLPDLLCRQPSDRESDYLGERRSGYSAVVDRDSKTLGRWSDQALIELRALLIDDTFRGDLYVVAGVRDDRILGCTLIQRFVNGSHAKRDSIEIDNTSGDQSLPCLVYGYPRDWRPRTLTMVATFVGKTRPTKMWGVVASDFFELVFAKNRYDVALDDTGTASCTFKTPRRDQLYALWWMN